ncbi:hypothetical protein ACFE04_002657 [Oxalis oulophora]
MRHWRLSGNSISLEGNAAESINQLSLGFTELSNAVDLLFYGSPGRQEYHQISRALIICIQMVSEAARFHIVEQLVRETIQTPDNQTPFVYTSFTPGLHMLSLENSWGHLGTWKNPMHLGVMRI